MEIQITSWKKKRKISMNQFWNLVGKTFGKFPNNSMINREKSTEKIFYFGKNSFFFQNFHDKAWKKRIKSYGSLVNRAVFWLNE